MQQSRPQPLPPFERKWHLSEPWVLFVGQFEEKFIGLNSNNDLALVDLEWGPFAKSMYAHLEVPVKIVLPKSEGGYKNPKYVGDSSVVLFLHFCR